MRRSAPVVAVLLLSTGIVTLARQAWSGVEVTRDLTRAGPIRDALREYRQCECIEDTLRRRVPTKAAVFITSREDLYVQRLAEMSTPRNRVVMRRRDSDVLIAIVPGNRGPCNGLSVRVERRRR